MQKITNGITGAQASDILWENDKKAISLWENLAYESGRAVYDLQGVLYKVRQGKEAEPSDIPSKDSEVWEVIGSLPLKSVYNTDDTIRGSTDNAVFNFFNSALGGFLIKSDFETVFEKTSTDLTYNKIEMTDGRTIVHPTVKGNVFEIDESIDQLLVSGTKLYIAPDDMEYIPFIMGEYSRGKKINILKGSPNPNGELIKDVEVNIPTGIIRIYVNSLTLINDVSVKFNKNANNQYLDIRNYIDSTLLIGEKSMVEKSKEITINAFRKMQSPGYSDLNITLPDSGGSYPAFWLRDYAITLMSSSYDFSKKDILKSYYLIKSKMTTSGEKAYWVPDHINLDGTPVWRPGSYSENGGWGYRASLDGAGFLIDIADEYVKKSNDTEFIKAEIDFLLDCVKSLLDTNFAVNVPAGKESCTFGFYDTVKFNGDIAFISAQCYSSFVKLKKWADKVSLKKEIPLNEVAASFNEKFVSTETVTKTNDMGITYEEDTCYVKASNGLSGQYDVWASAYAVCIGVLDGYNEKKCVQSLMREKINYIKNGQIRHVPKNYEFILGDACWESYFSKPQYGTYQNGGYWLTPVFWLHRAFLKYDALEASVLKKEALVGALDSNFAEHITEEGTPVLSNYLTSVNYMNAL